MKNEARYTVYMHVNKANGKIYVGQTGLVPENRWKGGQGYHTQPRFYEDILKYGWDNFFHIIVATGLTKIQAMQLEGKIILDSESYLPEKGYNSQAPARWHYLNPQGSANTIRCVETGEVFKSFNEAARAKGLSSGSCIKRVLNNPNMKSANCHWVQDE